ncbi:hypothetical protein ACL02S_23860 [Nocardia sp. 004]|uniref:hypothetical protein n=1 Tax=Nocardia sp. 004 TaxID=3385978 RepID=UPI00399F6561
MLFWYEAGLRALSPAVGDTRGATAAISQAWREVDRGLDDPNDTIGLLFVTPAEIRVIEARTRSYLGEHDKAVSTYRDAITSNALQPRDEASYRTYYAAALAKHGDTQTAVTEGLHALTMLEGTVKSSRLVAELTPVRAAAASHSGTDSEEFRLRFDALGKAARS